MAVTRCYWLSGAEDEKAKEGSPTGGENLWPATSESLTDMEGQNRTRVPGQIYSNKSAVDAGSE